MPEPLALYKIASTLFLGLGIAAVLQGRLIPATASFPISDRGRQRWTTVDIFGAFTMLVFIVAGEVLVQTVIRRGHAIGDEKTYTILLLSVASFYVVAQSILQRGLALAWKPDQTVNSDAVRDFTWAVI